MKYKYTTLSIEMFSLRNYDLVNGIKAIPSIRGKMDPF
jgi:hypothetical protein